MGTKIGIGNGRLQKASSIGKRKRINYKPELTKYDLPIQVIDESRYLTADLMNRMT